MMVHSEISSQLGMKRSGEDIALLHQNGVPIALCKNGDAGPDRFDNWCANENHLEGSIVEGSEQGADVAGKLASISVTQHADIQQIQRRLRWIVNFPSEQNGASART
jgi:hypothetical protein